MFILKKNKKLQIFCIFFILFIIVFSSMHISLFSDEGFTLGLIKNNYLDLIKIDSLDVHPPLYYILLKIFLSITTFWTNNIIFKIIFARLFSLLLSLITFFVLHIILKYLKIQNNLTIEFIIFILLGFIPFVFIPVSNFLIIRMYPLSALLIALQFLEILNFNKNLKNRHLIFILLISLGSFYTHYVSAIISGLLLLVLFFKYIYLKNINAFKLMLIGIINIIFYIPWLLIAFNQAVTLSQGNWWMDYKYFIINVFITLFFIFLFCIPLFLYRNKIPKYSKNEIIYLNVVIFLCLIVVFLISFLSNPMFQVKYMYPIFLLYIFINVNIILKEMKNGYKLFTLVLFILVLGNMYTTLQQIVHYDVSSINLIKDINHIKYKNNVKITKPNNKLQSQSNYYTIILYCKYSDKFVENYRQLLNPNNKLTDNNYQLYKKVYFGNRKYK